LKINCFWIFFVVFSGSVTIRQPSGHVRHETLWRELNNDRPRKISIVPYEYV